MENVRSQGYPSQIRVDLKYNLVIADQLHAVIVAVCVMAPRTVIDTALVVEPGIVGIEGDGEWPELGEGSCQGLLVLIVALSLGAGRNGVQRPYVYLTTGTLT